MATAFGFFGAPIETAQLPNSPELQAGPGVLQSVDLGHSVSIGALLGVTGPDDPSPTGGLLAVGMLGIVDMTRYLEAPGVRGWRLEFAPGFIPVPQVPATAWINNAGPLLVGSPGIRFRANGSMPFPPGFAEVWLVDAAGAPIDPAAVLGLVFGPLGPNFVSLSVVRGGILQRPT